MRPLFIKYYDQALTISGTHPVRTGHKFIGWSTSAGGGVVYHPGANYTANASAILYAVWQINTWNISYNANGGSGAPGSQTKTYGQTLTLSSTRPTRTGYTFKGWATSAGGVVAYQPGGSYTNNVGAMLYAVWEIIVLTVSFNATANGGSVSEASRRVNYGDRVGGLPGAQRQYYKFMGWFTAAEGGSQIRSEQVITANVTYYAQYKIDASLFEYRGGRWVPMIIFEYTGGRWQKVFAFEYTGGRWKPGIGG